MNIYQLPKWENVYRLGLILCTLMLATSAHALFEVKAGYSGVWPQAGDQNDYLKSNSYPEIKDLNGLSVDALAHLPTLPVGLGVRYEDLRDKSTLSGRTVKSQFTRVAVIVNKRFIDTLAFFGPIATVSLKNDFKMELSTGAASATLKANAPVTASLGLEAGLKLALLRLGAEAGYLYAPLSNLKSELTGTEVTSTSGAKVKADLSGLYARVFVGFGF